MRDDKQESAAAKPDALGKVIDGLLKDVERYQRCLLVISENATEPAIAEFAHRALWRDVPNA